jgi:predicted helicase
MNPHIYRKDLLGIADSSDFFHQLHQFANKSITTPKPKKYTPRPHQKEMVNAVVEGFKEHDRGKMLAACGVGKTLVSL